MSNLESPKPKPASDSSFHQHQNPPDASETGQRWVNEEAGLHLVVITGLSGSGKGSVVKAFEDSGFYCVDNMPVELLPKFVELVQQSVEISRAAVVIDIREGGRLDNLPAQLQDLRSWPSLRLTLLFLEAGDDVLMRRFSETRRPHPLAAGGKVLEGIAAERRALEKIRSQADLVVDTTKFNVHELRAFITERVIRSESARALRIGVSSFGFKNGIPVDSDLVFDVRFLPNPNYIPEYRPQTGKDADVANYILSFPQTKEFIRRISDLLQYLIPHYAEEGKSYLTISFGCTGGQHRSVFIAEEVQKKLEEMGYAASVTHRDIPRR